MKLGRVKAIVVQVMELDPVTLEYVEVAEEVVITGENGHKLIGKHVVLNANEQIIMEQC